MTTEDAQAPLNNTDINSHGQQRATRRRRKGEMRFGDQDFTLSSIDEYDEAEWGQVYTACCSHSLEEIGKIALGILGLIFFLYFYLFALDLLGAGSKVLSGCRGGQIFGSSINPVSAVMMAALATALLQSSSTTTSIIVALVSDEAITVGTGIYLVMGANIGTCITNDIISLAQLYKLEEFERAFAAAAVHDLFNILTVMVLLPFEVLTGYLEVVTQLIVDGAETKSGEAWEGPVEKWVKPLTNKLIISNSKAILLVAEKEKTCDMFYPTTCVDGLPESHSTCKTGFIACDKHSGNCPAFFRQGADLVHDQVAGGVAVVLSLIFCLICVTGMMAIAQWLLKGLTTRVVYKVANVNGYLGIALGAGLTMLLQSSSLTTSLLTPWVGIGVIRLEQMYPLTLGANIGTTLTAILVALVASGLDPLQVALAHLFFNITGVLIWYPIPHLRRVPIYLARKLGRLVTVWRFFSVVWMLLVFFFIPLLVIGITDLFYFGHTVGGALSVTAVCVVAVGLFVWLYFLGGGTKVAIFFDRWNWEWANRNKRGTGVAPTLDNMVTAEEEHGEEAAMLEDGSG